jgi:hypothetical protein
MALAGGALFLSQQDPSLIVKADPSSGQVVTSTPGYAQQIVPGPSGVWTTRQNTVSVLDPSTLRTLSTAKVGDAIANVLLATDGPHVWGYNVTDFTLKQLTP